MSRMLAVAALVMTSHLSILSEIPKAYSLEAASRKGDGLKDADQKEPTRIWEHRGSVLALEFTSDGDRLVTGGAAHGASVVIWEIKTGKRLLGLNGAGIVYSLSISPDAKKIATAGYTGINDDEPQARTVVWDADTGKELFAIKNDHAGSVPCIAFSPDGKLLATGTATGQGDDAVGSVQLWHADSGKKAGDPLVGPSAGFSRVKFSPDGRTVAAASWGAETFVVLWDVESRKQRALLKIKRTWALIRSLAFSPDSSRLAWVSGNEVNGNAEHVLWDVTTGKRVSSLRTNEMIAWIAFSAKGESLLTVDLGGGVSRWEMPVLKKTSGFPVELEFPTMAQSAALSPDGKTLVIGSGNSDVFAPPHPDFGTIRLFDSSTGRERLAPEIEKQRAKEEADEAARLERSMKDGLQREEKDREELAKLPARVREKIDHASTAASYLQYALHLNQAHQAIERGHFTAAKELLQPYTPGPGDQDSRSFEWHYLWRQCQFQKMEFEQPEAIARSWQGPRARFSRDGKMLAVPNVESEVILWHVATGKQGATLSMPGPVRHTAFSPDGKVLMTAGGKDPYEEQSFPPAPKKDVPSSRIAMLWEANTGKRLATLDGSEIAVGCIAFAEHGKTVAVGDLQGTVRIFEAPTGRLKASLPLGAESANTIAFSPDSTNVAVGGIFGAISLWDLANRKQTRILEGKDKGPINSVAFGRLAKTLYATEGTWAGNHIARRWTRKGVDKWMLTQEWKNVHHLAVSPNGARLALSGWHGVVLWDEIEDREVGRIVPRVTGDGLDSRLSFAPDSKTLLVHAHKIRGQPEYVLFDAETGRRLGAADNLLSGYDASVIHLGLGGKITATGGDYTGRETRMLTVLQTTLGQVVHSRRFDESRTLAEMTSLAFSADSSRLAASNGASVCFWQLKTDEVRKTVQSNSQPIKTVRFSADGTAVLSSDPSSVKIWDPDTTKLRTSIEAYDGSIGADCRSIYIAKGNHTIAVMSANDGKRIGTFSPKDAKLPANEDDDRAEGGVTSSQGGKWVAGLGAFLFDGITRKEVKRWTSDPVPLRFAFTADEKTLVTTDRKGTLTVWDLPKIVERHVLPLGGTALALSPDNKTSVLARPDGAMVLFDLASGTRIAHLTGLTAAAGQIVFCPEGKTLVTGNKDGTLQFWCPRTGVQRLGFRAHGGPITSIAFSPDGTILATGSAETVNLWLARQQR